MGGLSISQLRGLSTRETWPIFQEELMAGKPKSEPKAKVVEKDGEVALGCMSFGIVTNLCHFLS
jgi:hypothetical protein